MRKTDTGEPTLRPHYHRPRIRDRQLRNYRMNHSHEASRKIKEALSRKLDALFIKLERLLEMQTESSDARQQRTGRGWPPKPPTDEE